MVVRVWTRVAAAATALYHVQRVLLSTATAGSPGSAQQALALPSLDGGHVASGRLAVVVPVWSGDLDRALDSVSRWPTACSPVTLGNVDLIMYKAEGDEESSETILPVLERTAGRCFAKTKIVYAHLREEDNFYPKGPSVQFYKMFLDGDVRPHFSEYDAISIIEWDVMVAHDTSFEHLYHAAFGGGEQFWVKGSVLAGASFHKSAIESDMWHVLGHINGNAIYNNNDPAWVEFVEYTLTRWDYRYAYDVALWATISDFPYSWPLWQRYSSKFVTTNLIANVVFEKVDADTVGTAIAGDTLFIHGRTVEGGGRLSSGRKLAAEEASGSATWCEASCGDASTTTNLPDGISTACDASCGVENRFGGYLCGAGDSQKYGGSCRLCYTDQEAALKAEAELRKMDEFYAEGDAEARHVVMCDTMRPPSALGCSSECTEKKDTVCDNSCGSGRYGDYNCDWRGHGSTCRYCFDHVSTARLADEVAKRRGGRVIMCDTHEPPREEEVAPSKHADLQLGTKETRRLGMTHGGKGLTHGGKGLTQGKVLGHKGDSKKRKGKGKRWARKEGQKKRSDGGQGLKRARKRRRLLDDGGSSGCDSGCKSGQGVIRVCDAVCSGDDPLYHTRGCDDHTFGKNCRTCYTSMAAAKDADAAGNDAIMCDTLEYVTGDGNGSADMQDKKTGVQKQRLLETRLKNRGCSSDCKSGEGVIRVCDSICSDDNPLYTTHGCDNDTFGKNCRTCYTKMSVAKDADAAGNDAIMCDTLEYVTGDGNGSAAMQDKKTGEQKQRLLETRLQNRGCSSGCKSGKGVIRVCDSVCTDNNPLYGTQGCGDDTFGDNCRTCYTSMAVAKDADAAGKDAVMCDTLDYVTSDGNGSAAVQDNKTGVQKQRLLETRLKNRGCTSDCKSSGSTIRVCDSICSDDNPLHHTQGCDDDTFGKNCRTCYTDVAAAEDAGSNGSDAFVCDRLEYTNGDIRKELAAAAMGGQNEEQSRRRLSAAAERSQEVTEEPAIEDVTGGALVAAYHDSMASSSSSGGDEDEDFDHFAATVFEKDIVVGNLCAFVSSSAELVGETDATVRSVMTFMPGMRTAIAVSDKDFQLFDRTFGHLPGVEVSRSSNAKFSALLADKHCGPGVELIYYLTAGSLISRSFTSKDTHSPRGELLVAYSDGRGADYSSRASSRASSILLGFESPVFTFGTDLVLPANLNEDLRDLLLAAETMTTASSKEWNDDDELAVKRLSEVEDASAPEVLAAWAYSRNPEGLWFVNPQQWVSQHLFQAISIWNIPLIKPPFSCTVDPSLRLASYDLSEELIHHLEALADGATCESGFMSFDPRNLDRKVTPVY